jgi:hypothetical protein
MAAINYSTPYPSYSDCTITSCVPDPDQLKIRIINANSDLEGIKEAKMIKKHIKNTHKNNLTQV